MFKVGDQIVCNVINSNIPEVLTIINDWPDQYECVSAKSSSSIVLKSHLKHWRHADQQEIAAGHRIDNDMGDDSHIENHISKNCKVIDYD